MVHQFSSLLNSLKLARPLFTYSMQSAYSLYQINDSLSFYSPQILGKIHLFNRFFDALHYILDIFSPEIDSIWHVVKNNNNNANRPTILMCQQRKFAYESVNYTALRRIHLVTSNYFVYRCGFLS